MRKRFPYHSLAWLLILCVASACENIFGPEAPIVQGQLVYEDSSEPGGQRGHPTSLRRRYATFWDRVHREPGLKAGPTYMPSLCDAELFRDYRLGTSPRGSL